MDEITTFYAKVDIIAAWEKEHRVPFEKCLTYWFGDYGMDAPKYEHRDKIDGMYEKIMAEGHPLLNSGRGAAVYRQSEKYALAHGELDAYRESERVNAVCAAAIDRAISASRTELYRYDKTKGTDSVQGYRLERACASVITEHGPGRVAWVLANVIRKRESDGRLSYNNRRWAKAFPIPVEYRPPFALQTPSVILDGFAHETQKLFQEIRELAPESLAGEKPSVLEQIKEAEDAPRTKKETGEQKHNRSKRDLER